MATKKAFEEWLKNNGLAASVRHYVSSVKNISQKLTNKDLHNIDIFSYYNAHAYEKVKEQIFTDDGFIKINLKHNHIYSSALNHYGDFLREEIDNIKCKRESFDAFLKEWPLERLKTMTLEDYSLVGNKNTFVYWIEKKLDNNGSVWGGSSFKFGVYNRNKADKKDSQDNGGGRIYATDYAWYQKYGDNHQEAFEKVKGLIINIVEAVRNKNLDAIENTDLGDAYKWKIAFHYQNMDYPIIVPVFKKEALEQYLSEKNKTIAEMQKTIKHVRNFSNFEDLCEIGSEIWLNYKKLADNSQIIIKENKPKPPKDDKSNNSNFRTQEDSDYLDEIEASSLSPEEEKNLMENSQTPPVFSTTISNKRKPVRNPKIGRLALKKYSYTCEIDPSHTTFTSRTTGKPYMEAHHLIPYPNTEKFWNEKKINIDCIENIICLCPTCHRAIHFGNTLSRNEILSKLFNKRNLKLKGKGLELLLIDLLTFY